jgi:hypothetical protein
MRYMHAIGPSEAFVASGVYVHYVDNETTGTFEEWAIHELPDKAWMIRVDDDHRARDGSSVLIEAWRTPEIDGGQIERVDLHAFGGQDAEIKELRASYIVADGPQLEFGRSIERGQREQGTLNLPEGYLLSPESLIFAGFEVDELAARGQMTPVVGYLPTMLLEVAYKPVIYQQTASLVKDTETVTVGKQSVPVRTFEQVHPVSGERSFLWIDRYGVLLRYASADGRHRVHLTDYARRPDPK